MKQGIVWFMLILITMLSIYFLSETERNYEKFIESSSRFEVAIREDTIEENENAVTINFYAEVENPSPVKMWVEAVNYRAFVNQEYAGYYFMPEGRIGVPAGGSKRIPLEADLRSSYRELYLRAKEGGEVVIGIEGRARTKFQIGRAEMKVFYDFSGIIKERVSDGG